MTFKRRWVTTDVQAYFDFGDADCRCVENNSAIHFVKSDQGQTGVHLFQWVRNVDDYYKEILERGANVTVEPEARPYGVRDFSVQDPNGITVIFGQEIEVE